MTSLVLTRALYPLSYTTGRCVEPYSLRTNIYYAAFALFSITSPIAINQMSGHTIVKITTMVNLAFGIQLNTNHERKAPTK